jgi:CheY-like chemotaxis protein
LSVAIQDKGGCIALLKKVLIVDDNEGIRRLFTEVLANEGYSVDTAANGLLALVRLQECLPSLVLLDSKMPVMGGMEALSVISISYPDLPVILISAYTDQRDVKVALESGLVKHWISKPFSLTELIELLHSLNI